ncbi:MAG: Rne/Rng family ribonuclease [Alphaproteobacteria bacterium]|nr:Rne/Rng family ribonuclease [Alphaproteobacteria bacterium]MBV9063245.1 Rne/Rng family ribonuclease [Alphaproteobacteria bacterium]
MPKRMLIDASHREETRVVVLDGQRVDEFDFEAASKRPLKGNIYLAKVTRVEPSLQAAFVEYGGNRQGFLAFSEIHPDYYQIPVADRQALLAEQQEDARRRGDDEFEAVATGTASGSDAEFDDEEDASGLDNEAADGEIAESDVEFGFEANFSRSREEAGEEDDSSPGKIETLAEEEVAEDVTDQQTVSEAAADEEGGAAFADAREQEEAQASEGAAGEEASLESAAHDPQDTPVQPLRSQRPSQRWVRRRHYKIQEVIKRKQIMLVQVVKEERGTKGAALTTYLSLAGRYCVLMPNTPRGGGISRKITNAVDRNRLKAAAATLELPEGMGVIIRTAGANRTKLEIKRDYEYLLRMWDQIRELTLKSNAPTCVYEEGDIIKRAIRDLYNKDVAEILVEGEEGYKNAKEFMRMLMPSHAKNVKLYRDAVPVFQKHHIEAQLDAMFQPTVTLKSGGYIVINQTEALVSIDVNSGRATREHSIEETAHKTNLEAADEIARQLRLRDLAGLIVIDFIDMEDGRNDRDVEKRLREAVKNDRARVQIGKISQFGLLEMSRQRLRAGVVASSTIPCPHCGGQGIVRSVESTALRVMRALDEEGQRGRTAGVTVRVANDVAMYTLNQKRRELARIESDYDMAIQFEPSIDFAAGDFDLQRTAQRTQLPPQKVPVPPETAMAMPTDMSEPIEEEASGAASAEPHAGNGSTQPNGASSASGKKRRRRRRGRGGSKPADAVNAVDAGPEGSSGGAPAAMPEGGEPAMARDPISPPAESGQQLPAPGSSRRRRRRRRKPHGEGGTATQGTHVSPAFSGRSIDADSHDTSRESSPFGEALTPNAPSEPVWSLASGGAEERTAVAHESVGEMYYRREEVREPQEKERARVEVAPAPAHPEPSPAGAPQDSVASEAEQETEPERTQPQRRGWWQRTFKKD